MSEVSEEGWFNRCKIFIIIVGEKEGNSKNNIEMYLYYCGRVTWSQTRLSETHLEQ
jgi:hypothetical protein